MAWRKTFLLEANAAAFYPGLVMPSAAHGASFIAICFPQQGAGLLMKAIIEEGSPDTGKKMQMLALAEGAMPIHLVKALFIKSDDNRMLMQRQLSRHLISLWTADNEAATELLQRILVRHPAGVS